MSELTDNFTKGIVKINPTFVLLLGLCPTLAVSTSIENAIGMTGAVTFVLLCSNLIISLLRNVVPGKVRIPVFIVVIASLVTIVDLTMNSWVHQLHKTLGLFIPLIVVNCLILGRSEAFASRNPILRSVVDGFGMGVGFTFALFLLGACREIFGAGKIFGYEILGSGYTDVLVMILPPGAFIATGILLWMFNYIDSKRSA